MFVLNPINKKEIPEKVLNYIRESYSTKKTSSKEKKSSKNTMSKDKIFLQKMIGDEFTILTKDNVSEIKLFTDYYGSIKFITDLALDTDKLEKFSFYLDKSGNLKISYKDSYTFSPYLYKGVIVSSNSANPVIIRCKREKTSKCVVTPLVLTEPKKTKEKAKKNLFWFF